MTMLPDRTLFSVPFMDSQTHAKIPLLRLSPDCNRSQFVSPYPSTFPTPVLDLVIAPQAMLMITALFLLQARMESPYDLIRWPFKKSSLSAGS